MGILRKINVLSFIIWAGTASWAASGGYVISTGGGQSLSRGEGVVANPLGCVDFPCTGELDNFNRVDGEPINAPWSSRILAVSGKELRVVSSTLLANDNSGGNYCDQAYGTLFDLGDHEIYLDYVTIPNSATSFLNLFVKLSAISTFTASGYYARVRQNAGSTPNDIAFFRLDNNVSTALGTATITLTAGDQVGVLALNDVSGTLAFYINGVSTFSVTDATYSGQAGYLAVGQRNDSARMDNFGGGRRD